MSKIGNIYLVWRKGPGARRIPVGVIKSNSSEGVRFRYIEKNINDAFNQGFLAYTGFPDISKVYSENVIDIFAQRISKSERHDLNDFYEFWRVDPSKKTDAYYMLAKTQGLLPIDNFEFLADFNPSKGLNFITEIAGLTKRQISSVAIDVGDILTYELESNNKYDKDAVKLFKNDLSLGYVKLIHSRVFRKVKTKIELRVHHIERGEYLKRVFVEVLM